MLNNQTSLQAVIFDWAGTVVDHGSRAPVEAFVSVFESLGIPMTIAEARAPMGKAKREHIAELLANPRIAQAWQSTFHRQPDDSDVDRLYRDFLPAQRESVARHAQVIAGIPEVVVACRQRGMKIGSSTGYPRSLMETLVPFAKEGGFDPDVVISSDDVPTGRPAPWMIYRAAEQLGVYPMSRIVVVDDTIVGIEAARNAGCWAVGVSRTGNLLGLSAEQIEQLDIDDRTARINAATSQLLAAGAHEIVESVADLLPILAHLERTDTGQPTRSVLVPNWGS